jgi:glycosyltransferase involved in cell wall biosynthesis
MIDKILIVNPGPVYPVRSMSQMRTHNMIKTLSQDFRVDLLTPFVDEKSCNASCTALKGFGGEYIPIRSTKHGENKIKKRLAQAQEYINYYVSGTDREVTCYKRHNMEIIRIINEKGYKVIISNYWEGSLFFKDLKGDIFKILDPHYAVGENFDVLKRIKRNTLKYFFETRRLRNNLRLEKEVIENSDLLLPLSRRNLIEFQKINPDKQMLIIPDGTDIDHYLSYSAEPDPHTILFYGAMGSAQNIRAFWRLYNNIFPQIKKVIPDLILLVVGSGPPDDIRALHDGEKVIVTGYVEDVRSWLSKAWLSIIPLELGSGFRGRVIELMAMGIPVIGTHNALDSIGMKNGEEGFISDFDKELTNYCIDLMQNSELRNKIISKAKDLVRNNFSLKSTFGKLNKYMKSKYSDGSD